MMLVSATVEDFIINTHEICQMPWWSSIKVNNLISLAKKSSQYAENSIFHMIDIFLCPQQEPYYSAQEQKMTSVHPENIRICESLLRELSSRGSWHRYVVMEALVLMCSGKSNINLEDQAKKLVDVLVVVILILFRELNIPLPCQPQQLSNIFRRKMQKGTISSSFAPNFLTSLNMERSSRRLGFSMLIPIFR